MNRTISAITDVAVAALSAEAGAPAMRRVTDVLQATFGVDDVLFVEFRVADDLVVSHGTAPSADWSAIPIHRAPLPAVRALHPLADHLCRFPVLDPLTLSDVMSDREWRGTAFSSLVRPVWGRARQMHLGVDQHISSARYRLESPGVV